MLGVVSVVGVVRQQKTGDVSPTENSNSTTEAAHGVLGPLTRLAFWATKRKKAVIFPRGVFVGKGLQIAAFLFALKICSPGYSTDSVRMIYCACREAKRSLVSGQVADDANPCLQMRASLC